MKSITEAGSLQGKIVLLRLDFNMPIKEGKIVDTFRLEQSLPTLNFLKEQGAITIIVAHLESTETNSLLIVCDELKKHTSVTFCDDIFSQETEAIVSRAQAGDVILFENLRKWEGEKNNDSSFAEHLASFADLYVNDAFSVSHRVHSSIVGVPQIIPGYAGLSLVHEVNELSRAFNPEHPFLFILGGAKFETKIPLIEKFLVSADNLYIGGALANDVYKARGHEVGTSLVSHVDVSAYANQAKIILPEIVVVQDKIRKSIEEVSSTDTILDAHPDSVRALGEYIKEAKTIVWNGTLGNYEKGYTEGTEALAHMIAESDARSIIGGGDTLAAIEHLNVKEKFSFVSTGGGAMLDFLANGTLVGISALE